MNAKLFLRIKVTADVDAPFTAMFEPHGDELEIVNWQGGTSVWAPGRVVTLDADGNELHRLN